MHFLWISWFCLWNSLALTPTVRKWLRLCINVHKRKWLESYACILSPFPSLLDSLGRWIHHRICCISTTTQPWNQASTMALAHLLATRDISLLVHIGNWGWDFFFAQPEYLQPPTAQRPNLAAMRKEASAVLARSVNDVIVCQMSLSWGCTGQWPVYGEYLDDLNSSCGPKLENG
jgi:hypothetical protein